MFLIDTNCFIQLVRRRPEAAQVQAFLDGVPRSRLFVTLVTLHSIGVIMSRFGQIEDYIEFIGDLGIGPDLAVLEIDVAKLNRIADACIQAGLDFDDAYQYVAAEQNNLTIVSFDADFDHTPRGRLTPAAALQRFTDEQRKETP